MLGGKVEGACGVVEGWNNYDNLDLGRRRGGRRRVRKEGGTSKDMGKR